MLRKHEVDFGSPDFHVKLSKPEKEDMDVSLSIHSATFYANKGKTNSAGSLLSSLSQENATVANIWAKKADSVKPSNMKTSFKERKSLKQMSLNTGVRLAAKVGAHRRLASLSTLNLVYDVEYKDSNTRKLVRKRVVNGVSVIMNPGELVAIMGPSGSGKTTLLDCIARPAQKAARMKGDVFINGVSTKTSRGLEMHSCSIGYVRQLTTPWDPKLTVLENLVYAARLRLPKSMPLVEKLAIVSQCIADTGMTGIMDSIVGGLSGGGISGGQKRSLSVALQMILTPAVLIMDEPTVSAPRISVQLRSSTPSHATS